MQTLLHNIYICVYIVPFNTLFHDVKEILDNKYSGVKKEKTSSMKKKKKRR